MAVHLVGQQRNPSAFEQLAGPGRQRTGGSHRLQTAPIATKTDRPIREHCAVADFGDSRTRPSVRTAPDNQAAADAGVQRNIKKALDISAVSLPALPHGRRSAAVVDQREKTGRFLHFVAQRVVEQVQIAVDDHPAGVGVGHPWDSDPDPDHPFASGLCDGPLEQRAQLLADQLDIQRQDLDFVGPLDSGIQVGGHYPQAVRAELGADRTAGLWPHGQTARRAPSHRGHLAGLLGKTGFDQPANLLGNCRGAQVRDGLQLGARGNLHHLQQLEQEDGVGATFQFERIILRHAAETPFPHTGPKTRRLRRCCRRP